MGDKELAQKIIELVGNKENIVSVRHCATRLRIVVRDKDKIQVKMIESIEKVKGSFFNSGQYQIILGTGLVNRIYNEVINIIGESNNADEVKYGNSFQRAIRMFSDVFVPIIPVLVATGLFMGVRGLLMQDAVLAVLGIDATNIPESMLTFSKILTDTAFAFLPALVCWSTFRNFGGSPVIGMVLGLMLVSPSLPIYILVNVISFAVAFTITWFFGYNSKMETGTEKVEQEENNAMNKVDLNENNKVVEIASPLKGEVLLNEVKDEAFASGILGNGIAINPKEGVLVSPVNGVVNALLPTLHAIGITTQEGVELLIHIGMDTVKLKGEGFKAFVKQGDEIKIGQKLIEFDIDLLKSKGYCLDVPIVITNMMNYTEVVCTKETNINIGENLLSIK